MHIYDLTCVFLRNSTDIVNIYIYIYTNPVEVRTNICQFKDLIITLLGLYIYIYDLRVCLSVHSA
jgi:hypothetical protein